MEDYLDWDKVEERLCKYVHIGRHFSINKFRDCSNDPPYYCHYLAWRLGAWNNDNLFEVFDELLGIGSNLDNWDGKKNLTSDCTFGTFWSLLWELQMAKLFLQCGANVEWMPKGPDLKVATSEEEFYVECYVYRKSFEIEEFAKELFGRIDLNVRLFHQYYLPFSLPKDGETDAFLDRLFRPYLDPLFLEGKRRLAEYNYPVDLPVPESSRDLQVYLDGPNIEKYDPTLELWESGDSEQYLKLVLREIIGNKRDSNNLKNCRPNILAVNLLLSNDFQNASRWRIPLNKEMPEPDYGVTLDGVMYCSCGINHITPPDMNIHIKENLHPVLDALQNVLGFRSASNSWMVATLK